MSEIRGHFCGQRQPHAAHEWHTPMTYGSTAIISVYQCGGFASEDPATEKMRRALSYISSPTMGLPPGCDAAEFAMDGATEQAARYALHNCIRTARAATPAPVSESVAGGEQGVAG